MKTLFLLLFTTFAFSQSGGYPMDDMTHILSNFTTSNGVGNPCGMGNFIDTNIYDDMNMNYYPMEVSYAKITVHGNIVNEGSIIFKCDVAEIVVLGNSLNISENEVSDLKVFPIPTNDYLYVTGTGIKTIVVFDVFGRALKKYTTPTIYNIIDVTDLDSGMYFVKVNDETKKLIVN